MHVSLQYFIRDPALPVQVCVVSCESTALSEWFLSLQIFVSFPVCGVDLSVGMSEEVMC